MHTNPETSAKPFKRAGPEDRVILTNAQPDNRLFYYRFLQANGCVFLPEEVDHEAFERLMSQNAELRTYIEDPHTDPWLIAKYLLAKFPQIFIAIEQVYHVTVDYKIRRCKRVLTTDRERPEQETLLPADFYRYVSDDDIPIIAGHRLRTDVRAFNTDPEGYLAHLRRQAAASADAKEGQVLGRLIALFETLGDMTFPAFHAHIKGADRPFPSMHVRVWIQQMKARGNALICGDVGTQKTSAAIVGLHELGVTRTLVVARSYARHNVWEAEVPVYYRASPDVLVLEGASGLRRLEKMSTKELHRYAYLVVGYGDIQHLNGNAWVKALARYQPEGIIVDEAHAINHENNRSRRVIELARLPTVRHRVLLTATPFENNPDEMAFLAMLLKPSEFPDAETFRRQCRDNPRLFYILVKDLMCEYFAADDVLELPPSNVDRFAAFPTVVLEPSAAAKAAHDLIRYDGKLASLVQIQRMNQLLACPYIGRNWYTYPPEVNGYFRDPLKSDKLAWIKREIEKRITTGKVVVGSGLFASAITRGLKGAEEEEDGYVVAAQLRQWFGDEAVLVIDGSTDMSEDVENERSRAAVMDRWKNDPKARILVAAVQATAESVNLTLKKSSGCDKVSLLILTLSWKPTQLLQFIGRFRRPGMELPIEVLIVILRGLVDEAMLQLNQKKYANFLIGMQGVPLMQEETEALDKLVMTDFLQSPSRWMGEVYQRVRGKGEDRALTFLAGMHKDKLVGKAFARYYLQDEEGSLSGDVARFLAQMYRPWLHGKRLSGEQILDAACGPLVLERRLGEPVFGVDLNPYMLDLAREHSYYAGKNARVGRLSDLPEEWNGLFRLTVCSLALHWSANKGPWAKSERAAILTGLARVTAMDGLVHLILPPTCLEAEMLEDWVGALETLGLQRVPELTGLIESVDNPQHRRTFWSVCLRKVGEPSVESADAKALFFADERKRMTEEVEVSPKRGAGKPPAPPAQVKHEEFRVMTEDGAQTPEAVSAVVAERCFVDATGWCKPFVDIIQREYHPRAEWIALLTEELNLRRPSQMSHFTRIWEAVFHKPGAPKMGRERFRTIARQAMALNESSA